MVGLVLIVLAMIAGFLGGLWALAEISFRQEYAQAVDAMRKIEARAIVRVPVTTTLPTMKGKALNHV